MVFRAFLKFSAALSGFDHKPLVFGFRMQSDDRAARAPAA